MDGVTTRALTHENVEVVVATCYITQGCDMGEATRRCILALVEESRARGGWIEVIATVDDEADETVTATAYLHGVGQMSTSDRAATTADIAREMHW